MSRSGDVRPADSLVRGREMFFKSGGDVVAGEDDEAGFVAGGHDAEAAGVEVEAGGSLDAGEGVGDDHDLAFEALPALGGVHADGVAKGERQGQGDGAVHGAVGGADADHLGFEPKGLAVLAEDGFALQQAGDDVGRALGDLVVLFERRTLFRGREGQGGDSA